MTEPAHTGSAQSGHPRGHQAAQESPAPPGGPDPQPPPDTPDDEPPAEDGGVRYVPL
jgi:hypothetical protein